MAVYRTRMRITMLRIRMRMSGRVWKTTKTLIGVQRWGRVPVAVPRETSPSKSRLSRSLQERQAVEN